LISKTRALKPSVKIIGASGYGRATVRDEVIKAGGDEFIGKPFVVEELIATAKKLLGRT
jgi:DNA-binding response OmpR family regulator